MEKKKIVFIINPRSGTGQHKRVEALIFQILDHEKFEITIANTEYRGHAKVLAKEFSEKSYDYIVSVGGDGTLNEVVNGMINSQAILGIVATGSGNGLARHLGISTNPSKAIKTINHEKVVKIDTVSLNEHVFISIAGIGFDAFVARQFSLSQTRGFKEYAKIALRSFFTYKPKKYALQFPDGVKIKRAFFITLANSSQWGYNTKISPTASMTDGLVDVCIFKKPSILRGIFSIPFLFSNRISKTGLLKIIKTTEVTITRPNSKKMYVHIDGDDSKKQKEVIVKVNPLSLSVLIP